MIEQLSFFDNEKTEREKIFDTLVYDLSGHEYRQDTAEAQRQSKQRRHI